MGSPGCLYIQLAEVLCHPELHEGFICPSWHSIEDHVSMRVFIARVKPPFAVL